LKEPSRKPVGAGLTLLVVLIVAAVSVGYYYLTMWLPQHTDSDGEGWTDWEEMNKYHTDPKTPNPNAKHFVSKGGSVEDVLKIAVLDVKGNDGRVSSNNKGFMDYLFNENLGKLPAQQVAAVKSMCIQMVLKDSVVSDKEAVGLRILSQYTGEIQAKYASFSENVFEYFSTLARLLAKDPNKKDLADYVVLNRLRMKDDGVVSDYTLTALDRDFLLDPEKYARDVLNADLKRLEAARSDVAAELRKLPDYGNIDIKLVEANEDIVYTGLLQTPTIKTNLDKILNEGIPNKRKYDAALQALVWYFVDHNSDVNNPLESPGFDLRNFIQDVWRHMSISDDYQSDRWKDFDEVTDRLNSPFLVAKYMDDQLIYDAPKVVFDPSRTVTAKQTFAKKVGVCHDMANFAAYCLVRNGYEAHILRGGQKDWQKKEVQGSVITSRSHSVALYKEGPSFFVIQGPLPENRPRQHTVRMEGPFTTAEEAARQECCAKIGYAYEWHQLFKPDDPSFDASFFRKW